MNDRPIDRSKKSNIYCGHCEHWTGYMPPGTVEEYCLLTGDAKHYWNRCKQFEWKKVAIYLDEMF